MKIAKLGLFLGVLGASAIACADIPQQIQHAIDYAESASFSSATCVARLKEFDDQFNSIDWSKSTNQELEQIALNSMNLSWKLRLSLHAKLERVDKNCALQMQTLFHSLRDLEDYLAEFAYPDVRAVDPMTVDFDNEPTPIKDVKAYKPYFVVDSLKNKDFQFRSGDIMLARGVSFISPTIAQLTDNRSQYSHVVFVHVDESKTPQAEQTIESYVNVGVSTYDMIYALRNENSRLLVLRAKDAKLAQDAVEALLVKVKEAAAHGGVIPYDYKMDFNDHSAMSCAETVRAGFEWASKGKVILPTYPANISLNSPEFLAELGISKGPIFAPDDLEIDPNFEMILDWRDYSLIRDSRYKDAILSEMMDWLGSKAYKFHDTPKSAFAKYVLWPLNGKPVIWPLLKKGADTFKLKIPNLDSSIPQSTVGVMTVLGEVGAILLDQIREEDKAFIQKTNKPMNNHQLRVAIEKIRQDDLENYQKGKETLFHKALRPDIAEKTAIK